MQPGRRCGQPRRRKCLRILSTPASTTTCGSGSSGTAAFGLSGKGFGLIADLKRPLLSNEQVKQVLQTFFNRTGVEFDRMPCPETIQQVAAACSVNLW